MLQYTNLLSDVLKSHFRGFSRDVSDMSQVRSWFSQPLAVQNDALIDWTVKLKTFDWEPHQLILFDVVVLFLEQFSTSCFLKQAEEIVGESGGGTSSSKARNRKQTVYYNLDLVGKLAEFLRVFLFDHRLRYER